MEASRQEGMQVVAEGGSLFGFDMTLIADGVATLEHNIPLSTFYEDVLSYFSQSKTNYTPTLVVTFGGPAADPYWRSHTDVFDQPILKRHIPPAELAASSARRTIAPEADYVDDESAREPTNWPSAACWSPSAPTANRTASARTGSSGPSCAAA